MCMHIDHAPHRAAPEWSIRSQILSRNKSIGITRKAPLDRCPGPETVTLPASNGWEKGITVHKSVLLSADRLVGAGEQMDTPRARHLRGADDVAPWVAGSQIAWDLMARRHAPFTPSLQDNDDEPADPFAMLRELLDRMPAAPPQAQVDGAQIPVAVAVNDAGAYDDAYGNGGFGAVPASSEAIAGLRVTSAGEAKERGCTVCLQDFEGRDKLRRMPCSHSFHERCIFDWLRVSCACPLCRHRLPMERQ